MWNGLYRQDLHVKERKLPKQNFRSLFVLLQILILSSFLQNLHYPFYLLGFRFIAYQYRIFRFHNNNIFQADRRYQFILPISNTVFGTNMDLFPINPMVASPEVTVQHNDLIRFFHNPVIDRYFGNRRIYSLDRFLFFFRSNRFFYFHQALVHIGKKPLEIFQNH